MKDQCTPSNLLVFDCFAIEVCVDEEASIAFTRRFDHHGEDYVFAAAEMRLCRGQSSRPIIPANYPENFLESLKDLRQLASSPSSIQGIEKLIPCGGWCAWMAAYWQRVTEDSKLENDEALYDLLSPALFAQSKVGQIAIYVYEGLRIFEVATLDNEKPVINAWSHFSADVLGNNVRQLESVIQKEFDG